MSDRASEYAHRMWWLLNERAVGCSPYELTVLVWLTKRTIQFGKLAEIVPFRHFTHGISWGGKLHIPPINMSESTLKRALNGLVERGYIFKKSKERDPNTVYTIDFAGFTQNPSWGHTDPTYINQERNKPKPAPVHTHVREAALESVNSMTTLSPREAALAAVAASTAKTAAARDKKKTKQNASAYETMWKEAFTEAFPTERWFIWTIKDKAAFKLALDRGNIPEGDRSAFISHIVQNFTAIVGRRFKWMKQAPSVPAVMFAVKNVRTLWEDFEDARNPNRKVMHRVREAGVAKPVANVIPDHSEELEKLRKRNAELEAAVEDTAQKARTGRRLKLRKLTQAKPRNEAGGSGEFIWQDKD